MIKKLKNGELSQTKLVKHVSSFSRLQLAIFVLVFGLIGFLIYRSFAATPVIATLEAERMNLPASVSVVNDASASSGQAIKINTPVTVTGTVNLPSTATSLDVVAKATKCQGGWPKMTVSIDSTQLITGAMRGTSWTTTTATTTATSGAHTISISYAWDGKQCTPDLYVDVINVHGATPPPPPAPTVSLNATPTSVTAGQSSTLTWNSMNATGCTASGAWSGSQPLSGSTSTGALNATSTYTLNCTGAGGTTTVSTTVTVSPVQSDGYYYVDPNGSDAAGVAGTLSAPWKTVQHAVDSVPTGSTIRLNTGTYTPFVINKANLVVTATPGTSPVVTGQAGLRDMINITASGVTLSYLHMTGCIPTDFSPANEEDNGSTAVRIDSVSNVTVDHMLIEKGDKKPDGSYYLNNEGNPFGCEGIKIRHANYATITYNTIQYMGDGIFVKGDGTSGGNGTKILNNTVHDLDVIYRNNGAQDYGAQGIAFSSFTASPALLAQSNTMFNNQGPSKQYTSDGSGFEVFAANGVTMDSNIILNNDVGLESGTNGASCNNNRFTNNNVKGKVIGTYAGFPLRDLNALKTDSADGMILRCASNMVIDHNTYTNTNYWVFDVQQQGTYAGAINGITITNNTFSMAGNKVYAMQVNPHNFGFNFNNNQFHVTNGGHISSNNWISGTDVSDTLADWRSKSGLDLTSATF